MIIATPVPLFPEQASTSAAEVDALFFFLLALSTVLTVLIAWLVMYFALKYRRRSEEETPPPIHGSTGLEIIWIVIPLVVGLAIFVWGGSVYFRMSHPPQDSLNIYVVGKQWMWKLQHPGGQREINELHVPVGQPVKLTMISEDVIHSFYVPAFRMKQDVLPGRYSTTWFQATKPGRYHLFCAEYCGTGHSHMIGTIHVLSKSKYENWLEFEAEGSAALEGRKLFRKLKCITCHDAQQPYAPLLEAIYGQPVLLQDGRKIIVDDAYIRESILDPQARIVAGYQGIMPTFQGQVSEEEILQLIGFVKSLKRGDTPVRIEETPPDFVPGKEP